MCIHNRYGSGSNILLAYTPTTSKYRTLIYRANHFDRNDEIIIFNVDRYLLHTSLPISPQMTYTIPLFGRREKYVRTV